MTRIAIVAGSTRPGRKARAVADWVHRIASDRDDAQFDIVDLADQHLPQLDEPVPPALGRYSHSHTRRWAATIDGYDGFVFVTPEYNHSTSAALKNALDFVYAEWNNKAAGFVSYGADGGVRAVEQLRLIMAELQIACVRNQVSLSLRADFTDMTDLAPAPHQAGAVTAMLDQLLAWARALAPVRAGAGGPRVTA